MSVAPDRPTSEVVDCPHCEAKNLAIENHCRRCGASLAPSYYRRPRLSRGGPVEFLLVLVAIIVFVVVSFFAFLVGALVVNATSGCVIDIVSVSVAGLVVVAPVDIFLVRKFLAIDRWLHDPGRKPPEWEPEL